MRFIAFASVCLTITLLVGCGSSQTAQDNSTDPDGNQSTGKKAIGGLAVVDLDVIAKRLGRDVEINQAITQKQGEMNQQLASMQKRYHAEYKELVELYGEEPTEKELEKLKSTDRQLGVQITSAQRNSQNALTVFRKSLVDRFREEVRPVARRIASARGLTVVVTRDERTMLSVDASADITEAVLEEISSTAAKKTSYVKPSNSTQKVSSNTSRGGSYKQ